MSQNWTSPNRSQFEKIGELVAIFVRGNRWYANYQLDGKQHQTSLKTTSKKEARLRANKLETKLLAGEVTSSLRSPSLAEVVRQYLEAKAAEGLAKRTLRKYEHCFKVMQELAEDLGIKLVAKIDARFMDRFRKQRVDELSKRPGRDGQKSAVNDLVTIRCLINFALKRNLITTDPLANYSIKKAKTKPQPFWSLEELDQILRSANRQPHADVFQVLASTGTRIGELEHLTWDDVDLKNRVIKIQAKPGWKPKTGDARVIQMMASVYDVIARQPRCTQWVFSFPADSRGPARQIRQRRLLEYLKRVLKKLKLRGHLHTFRHTFISLALISGTPEAQVREWVGHVDSATIRRYTHIASYQSQAAMSRLEKAFAAPSQPSLEESK